MFYLVSIRNRYNNNYVINGFGTILRIKGGINDAGKRNNSHEKKNVIE